MIQHISAIALSERVRDHGRGSRIGASSQRGDRDAEIGWVQPVRVGGFLANLLLHPARAAKSLAEPQSSQRKVLCWLSPLRLCEKILFVRGVVPRPRCSLTGMIGTQIGLALA
ncbi:MAG: hypothetical protein RBU45_07845 [Myxococcota bacterium]|jgi:hypothetical protein|nr:hypothetical protein [Myxococcota bacterium]